MEVGFEVRPLKSKFTLQLLSAHRLDLPLPRVYAPTSRRPRPQAGGFGGGRRGTLGQYLLRRREKPGLCRGVDP